MFFNEILGISDPIFLSVIFSSIRLVKGSKYGGQVVKTDQICHEQSTAWLQYLYTFYLMPKHVSDEEY